MLVYERAGINHSKKSDKERTPTNIAIELKMLLDTVSHEEKIVVIGHSQGGLYASEFCGLYRIMKIEDGCVFYQKRKSEPDTTRNFT